MSAVKCPRCAGIIKVREDQVEDIGTCPHCGQKYRLPRKTGPGPAPARSSELASAKKSHPPPPAKRRHTAAHEREEDDPRPYGMASQPEPAKSPLRHLIPTRPENEEDSEEDSNLEAPVRVRRKREQEPQSTGSAGDLVGFLVLCGIAVLTVAAAGTVYILRNN